MSSPVVSCGPEMTVFEAVKIFKKKKIGDIVVLKEEKLVGIMTEQDIVIRVIAEGKDYRTTTVGEVMTSSVYAISPEASLLDVSKVMNKHKLRHAIVIENEKVIGIITARDLIDIVSG
jgi:CBS domain-containing protein